MLELPLSHGDEVNAQDEPGKTPLHLILVEEWRPTERGKTVRVLLRNGADPNIKESRDRHALETNASKDFVEMVHSGIFWKNGSGLSRDAAEG